MKTKCTYFTCKSSQEPSPDSTRREIWGAAASLCRQRVAELFQPESLTDGQLPFWELHGSGGCGLGMCVYKYITNTHTPSISSSPHSSAAMRGGWKLCFLHIILGKVKGSISFHISTSVGLGQEWSRHAQHTGAGTCIPWRAGCGAKWVQVDYSQNTLPSTVRYTWAEAQVKWFSLG